MTDHTERARELRAELLDNWRFAYRHAVNADQPSAGMHAVAFMQSLYEETGTPIPVVVVRASALQITDEPTPEGSSA